MKRFDRRTMMRYSGMAAAALAMPAWAVEDAVKPVAATTAGRISGVVENGINVFRGVPYGGDTAKTRFKAPVPPEKWSGVKECVSFTTMAPQIVSERAAGAATAARTSSSGVPGGVRDQGVQSEDCLHLNVWTPGLRDGKKRAVLLYIHGGAYNNGTVNNDLYDGNRLCHRGDVVVVTVNHRLNAFGYLYLGDVGGKEYAESGNVGQLDLVLALKWVRENIAEFGGDAARVVIFGQSGGGAKCATLMAMPVAKGLFTRVMSMSGQQIKGASVEIASERAKVVLAKMGVTAGKDLEAQLNGLTMEQIQAGTRAVSSDWLPVVDHVVLMRNPFDPDAPELSEGVPMILGNTHDETNVSLRGKEMTWEDVPGVLQSQVGQYIPPYSPEEVVTRYREIYPAYTPDQVATAAATAFRAWPGQRWEAERRAQNPKSQVHTWAYQMDWKGIGGKAQHTIDIPFMFDNLAMAPGQIGTSAEQIAAAQPLADVMSEMLIRYGKTGNPNGDGAHPGMPMWPAYDLKERNTMMWELPVRVEKDPRAEERKFAEGAHYHQAGTPLP
jgi:para-nitrobenzyl esterase